MSHTSLAWLEQATTLEVMSEHNDPHTSGQTAGSISVAEEIREEMSPGDNERFSHYVRQDRLTRSMVEGTPVIALCGKVWVPFRDPKKFPLCPTCKALRDQGMNGGGDGGGVWPFGPNRPGEGS